MEIDRYDRLGRKVESGDYIVYVDQRGFHCLLVTGRNTETGQWLVGKVSNRIGDEMIPLSSDTFVTRKSWIIDDILGNFEFLVVSEFDGRISDDVRVIR